jgi:hypothetical protein
LQIACRTPPRPLTFVTDTFVHRAGRQTQHDIQLAMLSWDVTGCPAQALFLKRTAAATGKGEGRRFVKTTSGGPRPRVNTPMKRQVESCPPQRPQSGFQSDVSFLLARGPRPAKVSALGQGEWAPGGPRRPGKYAVRIKAVHSASPPITTGPALAAAP